MSGYLKKCVMGIAGALAMTMAGAGAASAAPVFGSIPDGATNEALQPLFGTDTRNGWYGATLYLIGGPVDILVEYLGSEAGFNNNFTFEGFSQNTGGGTNIFNPGGITSTTLLNVASGILNFSFTSPLGTVTNGDPNDNVPGAVNFFVSFANENASGGVVAYLFLDDAGAGDDDNHDDMVIRISIVGGNGSFEIPIPAAAWLMLAGIGGIGGLSMRKRRQQQAQA